MKHVQRTQIVLASADHLPVLEIANRVGLADLAFDKTSNVIVRRAEIPSTIAEARQKETKLSNAVAGTTKRMIGEERYVWSSHVRPRFGEP